MQSIINFIDKIKFKNS